MAPISPQVWRKLEERAGPSRTLRFDQFMEVALYDPEVGYYARDAHRAGRDGDFLTSVEVSPLFGACIARFLHAEWVRLGRGPLDVIELGAGRGTLAQAIHDEAEDKAFRSALRFHLVERSEAARRQQGESRVPSVRSYADASELPQAFAHAVAIANELFDNLPVRRVARDRTWKEIVLHLGEDRTLREARVQAPPDLLGLIESHRVRIEPGQLAEVCPSAGPLVREVLGRIQQGAFLLFDYGDEAERLYGDAFPGGTLAAHRAHRTGGGYYESVGKQDLTAHVNFTVLRETAESLGFTTRLTTQSRFLLDHGLPELVAATVSGPRDELAKARATQSARILSHPEAMGGRFRVLQGTRPARL